MRQKDLSPRHERLRHALRRGDPAAGETGLSSAEHQAIRRTVLSAAEEPRQPRRLVFVVAAAAAVLSLAVGLALRRAHQEPRTPPVPEAQVVAVPAAPAAPRPAPTVLPAPPRIAQRPAVSRPPRHRRRAPQMVVQLAALPAAPPLPAPDLPAAETAPDTTPKRQVQFATAGGTRIIWMLPERTR
jgi:hypothetical protein